VTKKFVCRKCGSYFIAHVPSARGTCWNHKKAELMEEFTEEENRK